MFWRLRRRSSSDLKMFSEERFSLGGNQSGGVAARGVEDALRKSGAFPHIERRSRHEVLPLLVLENWKRYFDPLHPADITFCESVHSSNVVFVLDEQ